MPWSLIPGELLWRLKAERGVPLDLAFDYLAGKWLLPTWDAFFTAARRDGANLEKLSRDVIFFVRESYPSDVYAHCARLLPLMPAYTARA